METKKEEKHPMFAVVYDRKLFGSLDYDGRRKLYVKVRELMPHLTSNASVKNKYLYPETYICKTDQLAELATLQYCLIEVAGQIQQHSRNKVIGLRAKLEKHENLLRAITPELEKHELQTKQQTEHGTEEIANNG